DFDADRVVCTLAPVGVGVGHELRAVVFSRQSGHVHATSRQPAPGRGAREQGIGMTHVFVAGTDTGIGKTHVSVALLHALRERGDSACGMKPVASGCRDTSEGRRNEDALALQAASAPRPGYAAINPVALSAPVSPHLAAD